MGSLSHLFFNNKSFSATAQAIIDATPTATEPQKAAINAFVNTLIAQNIWSKIIAWYGVGSDATELKQNCKNLGVFNLTENAGGTYAYSVEGILLGSNALSYFGTGINCLSNIGSNATLIAATKNLSINGNLPFFGAQVSTSNLALIAPLSNSIFAYSANISLNPSHPVPDKNVILGAVRTSSTDFKLFKNAAQIGSSATTISGALPNTELMVGKYVTFSVTSQSVINSLIVGAGMSVSDYQILRSALAIFLADYGKVKDYYLFYGDSNTEAGSFNNFASQTVVASNKFKVNNGHSGWSLQYVTNTTNSGYYGRVSAFGTPTIPDKIYVLMWGTNDIGYNCHYAGYTAANFNTQYRAYIDYMLSIGLTADKIIIMSPPFMTQAARNSFWGTNINNIQQADVDVYLAHCAQIASDYGIKYVELYNAMAPDYLTLLGTDGVHLTQLGHNFVTEKLLAKLRE